STNRPDGAGSGTFGGKGPESPAEASPFPAILIPTLFFLLLSHEVRQELPSYLFCRAVNRPGSARVDSTKSA
ncbi:MAG: hypothetical protein VB817_13000, partial [Pirellulaceae bacterium]